MGRRVERWVRRRVERWMRWYRKEGCGVGESQQSRLELLGAVRYLILVLILKWNGKIKM